MLKMLMRQQQQQQHQRLQQQQHQQQRYSQQQQQYRQQQQQQQQQQQSQYRQILPNYGQQQQRPRPYNKGDKKGIVNAILSQPFTDFHFQELFHKQILNLHFLFLRTQILNDKQCQRQL